MPFDVNEAIQHGQLVQYAYLFDANDLQQRAGSSVDAAFDPLGRQYRVITTIYGNDLLTDLNPGRGNDIVSYGFVLQDASRNVVICIRGTDGISEWLHDAAFLQKPYPDVRGAGNTEDGFTTIYETLSTDPGLIAKLVTTWEMLPFLGPVKSVTVCGHSLGAALVTLLALDLSVNKHASPVVFTYASPRVGDNNFAAVYSNCVPNTYRVANQLDLVPKLPLEHPMPPFPQYTHVGTLVGLNPFALPIKVMTTLRCEHMLTNYQYLLTDLPGLLMPTTMLPQIDPSCAITGTITLSLLK